MDTKNWFTSNTDSCQNAKMTLNCYDSLNFQLLKVLLNNDNCTPSNTLLKTHTKNLCENGDSSFPIKSSIWHKNLSMRTCLQNCQHIFDHSDIVGGNIHEKIQVLLSSSKVWNFPLRDVRLKEDRCILFYARLPLFSALLQKVLVEKDYGITFTLPWTNVFIPEDTEDPNISLSNYRAKLVKTVLRNLLILSKSNLTSSPENSCIQLNVVNLAAHGQCREDDTIYITCGVPVEPVTGKVSLITFDEYKRIRSTDMRLIAMHKYGIRDHSAEFDSFVEKLGAAAVTVDLLAAKHTSPVQVVRNGQGNSRGAAFILYNYARIETLLRNFKGQVENGKYPPLPPLVEVDLELLKEEEEWQLLYNYVLPFPELVKKCLHGLERGSCALHLIIQFLTGLASIFSVYYRRVKILLGSRIHLLGTIYSRIYFIQCIRDIMNISLSLLDICPINYM